MANEKAEEQKKESIRLMIVERMFTLLTAALSLVAALAWNDAIQSLFREIFGEAASIYAKFYYAIFVTALVVFVIYRLSKFAEKLKNGFGNKKQKE